MALLYIQIKCFLQFALRIFHKGFAYAKLYLYSIVRRLLVCRDVQNFNPLCYSVHNFRVFQKSFEIFSIYSLSVTLHVYQYRKVEGRKL